MLGYNYAFLPGQSYRYCSYYAVYYASRDDYDQDDGLPLFLLHVLIHELLWLV